MQSESDMTPVDRLRRAVAAALAAAALCLVFLAAPAAGALPGRADAVPAAAGRKIADYVGAFHHTGGDADRRARDDAIEDVVKEMSFIVRGIARDRLKEANPIAQQVGVALDGEELTVSFDSRRYTAPLSGEPVEVVGITGDTLQLRHRFRKGRVLQLFDGGDKSRRNVLSLDDEGRLTVRVTVSSEKLPKDLK